MPRINYSDLPEARDWKVGKIYRVKMVLRQTGADEEGTSFDLVDVTSLEPTRRSSVITSEGGEYRGQ